MPRDPAPSLLRRLSSLAREPTPPWHGPPPALPTFADRLGERWFALPPRVRLGLLVAGAFALLLLTGLGAARSPWGPPVPVLVVAADVDAGEELAGVELERVRRPARLVPADAVTDPARVAAARAGGRLVAGTVLTERHLAGEDGVASGLGPGRAAFALDASALPVLAGGERIDVVAGDLDGHGRVLARDARVLAVVDGTVWLDVAREEAAALAGAALRDGLHVVLLPPA